MSGLEIEVSETRLMYLEKFLFIGVYDSSWKPQLNVLHSAVGLSLSVHISEGLINHRVSQQVHWDPQNPLHFYKLSTSLSIWLYLVQDIIFSLQMKTHWCGAGRLKQHKQSWGTVENESKHMLQWDLRYVLSSRGYVKSCCTLRKF